MSHQQWAYEISAHNYHSANLLLYYFLRIDGEGKGEKLVDYLKARVSGMKEEEAIVEILLAGRSFEQLQEDVAKGWKSEGLKLSFR